MKHGIPCFSCLWDIVVLRCRKMQVNKMTNHKVFDMSFVNVYQLLIAKAERKGKTKEEVNEITSWLTGYSQNQITDFLNQEITYGDFFRQAPAPHPNRVLITGKICGVRIEEIEDPLMKEIRYLDKLIDELAKGKTMDKILRR